MANDGAPSAQATPQGTSGGEAVNPNETLGKNNQRAVGVGAGTPGKAGAAKDPVARAFERYKVAVDGREEDVDLDSLKAGYSKSKAADKRFEEAAVKTRRADQLENALKSGDFGKLLDLGMSKEQVRAHIEKYYHREFIEPEGLTEDQKLLRAAEARLKKFEDEEQKRTDDTEKAEMEKFDVKAREDLQTELIETLEKSGLPKNRFYMARIAYWTKQNLQRGWNAPQEVIINQVKKERDGLVHSLVDSHQDESLFAVLGDKVSDRIRKLDLQRIRKARGLGDSSQTKPEARTSVEREPTSKKTLDDVDAEIRKMFRKKR